MTLIAVRNKQAVDYGSELLAEILMMKPLICQDELPSEQEELELPKVWSP